ncbi:3-hydroxyisobutyrate dehydrogenase, mitochondrial isoform X2 [Venturia canescens]|uniref:3-hydroxyisobutyrate dehydrogenase, mitochondrial isoform X2 n=1 Tax=Venturia canescens TaxID=32260 RepID=UPI001C9BE121|nr:3-hydroxyisobutyrate dehydrogenase, mitochondrial isoform X2 [Venturia canescens]
MFTGKLNNLSKQYLLGEGKRNFANIGFVGLGNMGSKMARNMLKKGYKITVYDVNKSAVSSLVEAGANGAPNLSAISDESDIIVSMLPSNQHVLDCYVSQNGILSGVKKNALLIDCSTINPSVSQQVAAEAAEKRVNFVDAPVSGGVNAAAAGTLTFMVGGTETNFDRAKPILECMGSRIFHCGEVGLGQAAKLCNNMLLAISMIGTAEAFNLGSKLGLDPKVLASIINSSSGRCWSSEQYNPVPGILENVPSSNSYKGGFGAALMTKDLGLAQEAAGIAGAPIPLGSLAHQLYKTLLASGFTDKDFSVIYQFLKGNN